MLEQVLKYSLVIVSALCGVLFLLLRSKTSRIVELEQKAAVLQVDKDLAVIKEKSDASEKTYEDNKRDYDRLKQSSGLLGRIKNTIRK